MWAVGFVCECLADFQKYNFKQDPKNKGKFIDVGGFLQINQLSEAAAQPCQMSTISRLLHVRLRIPTGTE